jgi:uncharacterized protein (DUF1684 family)
VTVDLDLLDWRRRVNEMYAALRDTGDVDAFRAARADLFRMHPQSPRAGVELRFAPYDRAWRFEDVPVEPAPEPATRIGDVEPLVRIGVVRLPFGTLDVWWVDVYGGGVFVPLRDATAGDTTYGGGRYVLDTAKGADLGGAPGTLTLDLNHAYHPSCAYDPRWTCPLAPPGNVVDVRVDAGELLPARPS